MFTLKKQIAVLSHLNLRDEKHGEETVLAADLKIKADVPNLFLEQLAPGLRASLYKDDEDNPALFEDGHMPVLRYSQLEPLKFAVPMPSAQLVIQDEDPANPDLEFTVAIKNILLDCRAGGTVAITFSAATLPDAHQVGSLSALLGSNVTVSLFGGEISKETAD
tara:strand:+ start:42481 stop:42972 length:492 start_codon:yes stop_codon:yes gene_type:complete